MNKYVRMVDRIARAEDCLSEACEWVDYNTIRSVPYMDSSHAPIIVYEFPEQKKEG